MKTISDQKEWERAMTALGVARFRATEEKAKDNERFQETSAGSRLLKVYMSQVSNEIMERIASPLNRNKFSKLIRGIDPDKLALFTLHRVIECVYKPGSAASVCARIGKLVEDELRFSKFEIEMPEYYNAVQRDLDRRHSTQYQHRHRVLVKMMNDKDVEWHSWTNETHIGVGAFLVGCAERVSDLVQRYHQGGGIMIGPSDEVIEWITKHDESIELMFPDRMPCIHKPADWQDWREGGFYTRKLRGLTPLVKTRYGQQRDAQSALLDTASMPVVLASVNAMQNTDWAINTRVHKVVAEVWDRNLEVGMPRKEPYEIPAAPIPDGKNPGDLSGKEKEAFEEWKAEARTLHGLETERKSGTMSVMRALRMAQRLMVYDMLWMVYQLDFRGRTYTTTNGVSPQGNDISKAMLHFGTGKALGSRGWFWFRVHGANKYGNDKGTYESRVAWVGSRAADICRVADDPIGTTDIWGNADKPYQFLAWCFEFADAYRSGSPETYVSQLPVALDGSCNGLQHFSAMLRDPVGGRSVNLVASPEPADIYQDVADVATEKLLRIRSDPSHEFHALAANWLALFGRHSNGKMGRKLAKPPVMTLPYGSTLQTCTQTTHRWYLELKDDFFPDKTAFKHSVFMAKIIWESIGEVVIAARAAMKWLQKVGRILAKNGHPVVYVSPIGFPMVQFTPLMEKKDLEAQIGGRIRMKILKELPGIDPYKAANGISPNTIHEVDSTHMHMVVAAAVEEGMTHFAMIHDDFGTHACHIERFQEIIREQFVKLHSETRILDDLKAQHEERYGVELPDVPPYGSLDLKEVIRSPFFFG